MPLKKQINDTLAGLTGYQLTRRPDLAAKPVPKRAPKAARKAEPPYPQDFDEAAIATIESVKPRTMTSNDKLYALIVAVRYVVEHKIAGDIVECGVWRGGSMQTIARTLGEAGETSRDLYLFDTFEGMPPPSDKDVRHDGASAEALMAKNERREGRGVWAYASLEDVREGMDETGYPSHRIHYRQGLVEDTVPEQAPAQISILRLDTDWYESTKHELDTLYSRLTPGGVLMIDDYGWWQGSRTATDEFLAETGEPLLLMRMGSGRLALKPR